MEMKIIWWVLFVAMVILFLSGYREVPIWLSGFLTSSTYSVFYENKTAG